MFNSFILFIGPVMVSGMLFSSYDDFKTCAFAELKMKLPKKFNHSLQLIAYIICWEKNKTLSTMIQDVNGVTYDITNDTIIFKGDKRAKIIYVKDILKKINDDE